MKYLLLLAVLLGGCAGQVAEPELTPEEIECELSETCRADSTSSTFCLHGTCACTYPTHPGENRAYACTTGEPDGEYGKSLNPWAKKP